MTRRLPWLCLCLAGLLAGCGDDDGVAATDAGSDTGPEVLDCMNTCLDTGSVRCTGAPPEFVDFYCGELCMQGPTDEQISCVNTVPCEELIMAAMMSQFPCGIPGMLPMPDEDAGPGDEDAGPGDEDAGTVDAGAADAGTDAGA